MIGKLPCGFASATTYSGYLMRVFILFANSYSFFLYFPLSRAAAAAAGKGKRYSTG